jgi:hypothetical protein
MKRRDFIKGTVAAAMTAALPSPIAVSSGKYSLNMLYRKLGRTGENVSLLGIGGAHLGIPKTDAEAVRIVRTAIDNGVNFMDNCWDYWGGTSELRMGRALRDGYRGKVFLMTKIDGQDAKTAAAAVPFMKSLRFILFVIEPIRTAFCGNDFLFLKGRCLHKRSIGSASFSDLSICGGRCQTNTLTNVASLIYRGRGGGVCQMESVSCPSLRATAR